MGGKGIAISKRKLLGYILANRKLLLQRKPSAGEKTCKDELIGALSDSIRASRNKRRRTKRGSMLM